METAQIINETDKLPIYQQMIIVEHIIRSIRHTEKDRKLEMAMVYNSDQIWLPGLVPI